MTAWKQAVARAFDAAQGYEGAARIQTISASGLARTIAARPLSALPRTLEVGCGTGLFTRALRSRIALGPMLATDIAPAMIGRCRGAMEGTPDLNFAVMDAERPALTPSFDLIGSNLAAQWFVGLETALAGLAALLRPGGLLAVTTLADGTFREWQDAQRSVGQPLGARRRFPSPSALRAMRFSGCTNEVSIEDLRESHDDAAAFLRALRAIGAQTPVESAAIRSAGTLRRALRALDQQGAIVTYTIATCLIRRSG